MKLLGSVIASAALAIGTLVAVPPTASAAPPYPGTVATQCSYAVPGSVRKNRRLNVAYRVRANGNARPSGLVTFTVWRVTKAGNLIFNRAACQRLHRPAHQVQVARQVQGQGKLRHADVVPAQPWLCLQGLRLQFPWLHGKALTTLLIEPQA